MNGFENVLDVSRINRFDCLSWLVATHANSAAGLKDVSTDFVEALHKSQEKAVIMVVVDR